ncbi:septum formation inhibitor Maf [Oryzomonas japonica]|uniref:dTTP/UTP pyrophosphatase n=1 Tax=Oryzomonas japonica TaxID=2603858 RepID=A0A7J4ZQL0_9BACT|nr:Maf family nucleotide pyrophosphatase [Oryzomonas japonica]KAB0665358.1 septum formation inhibitor Maf [Oryzomonas japonica]
MKHGAIVLASASPRRTELMALAGIEFTVVAADICEDALPGEKPSDHVIRLSREKADAVAHKTAGRFFIGADTVVVLDGTIMGKPADDADAFRMLTALSGRNHEVITGFTVFDAVSGIHLSRSVHTDVTFRTISEKEIRDYIASGCPRDKAGAYAIQGGAVHFVRSINGSYTNVVGLPMAELYEVLQTVEALP